MDKYAVIDLGTNTFHLLIASINSQGKIITHHRLRKYIHLAQDGIKKIGSEPYQKAVSCIAEFKEIIDQFNITNVKCSGTAALRTASNGPKLVAEIFKISQIEIDIIDGLTEAKYIYQGVSLAAPYLKNGNHLIMDIGGGSVEFIIIKEGHFHWSGSFNVGIAVLKRKFHHSEPIHSEEIQSINSFLINNLAKFIYVAKNIKFDSLIGASGSFEVLKGMSEMLPEDQLIYDIPTPYFNKIYKELLGLTLNERLLRNDIPKDRAPLIIVAFQLIKFILSQFQFNKIVVSAYAMKEGMLREMIENK